jgi:hypothetical protein
MDVIEKAARAVYATYEARPLYAQGQMNGLIAEELVRAVLLAIREPSEAMVAAGTEDSGIDGYVNDFHPIVPWQAMIDAALECPATPAS